MEQEHKQLVIGILAHVDSGKTTLSEALLYGTGTIRKHHQRGKISDDLRREALYLAESYRDKALMDNDYAADGYARDMELEHIYAEAEKRLK